MKMQVASGLFLFGLLAFSVNLLTEADAQAPYWDSSTDSGQPYYSPQPQQQQQPAQQYQTQPSTQYYGNPYGTQSALQGYNNGYNSNTYGQSNYGYQSPTQLQGYVSTAPAGTMLMTTTTTYLSSDRALVGDPVSVTLNYDLAMNGSIVLPAGTQVQGQVVSAIPAGRAGRHGQIQIRFNRAILPDGRNYPLSARLVTQDGTGIIRGGTGTSRMGSAAKNTLGGAAIGAAAGTALGAIVGGGNKWNEGMLWGSILGAGSGLARTGVSRGEEAELNPGTQIQLMLDQPLTTSAN